MRIVKENPFLGLKPYELEDRKKLYGRDKDLFLMKDRIFSGRTTLLFAGPGVGKTSFINAKVIPELESKYDIVYHNQWAIGEPLAAVMNSIRDKLRRDSGTRAKSLTATGSASLLDRLNAFTQPVSEDGSNVASHRCLLILDQFEEVFPHHSHQRYFARFVEELAELINSDCNVRLLFSMRDDFLGGLSVFDNKIPNLFSNYYHLKCPSAEEAEDIIQSTSNFVDVPVNEDNLKVLVHDLAQIKGSESVPEGTVPGGTALAWDIVEPPALQIACKRLWEQQFDTRNDAGIRSNGEAVQESFLADYQAGEAHKMVDLFFRETLESLSKRERALVADSFDYLVTKKGAKMAYELNMLTGHMNVEESALKPVLEKLSEPETRILRRSDGPHKSVWFELYHDMYGPISDKWKRDYRLGQKAGRRRVVAVAGVVLLVLAPICIWAYMHWVSTPQQYETKLREANLQDPENYNANKNAFEKLSNTWGWESKARRLWFEAWERRADLAKKNGNADEALLSSLTAAAEGESDHDSTLLGQIGSYLSSDNYGYLLASFWLDRGTNHPAANPVFSADGKTIISLDSDRRIVRWNAISAELAGESPPLTLDDPISRPEPPKNSPATNERELAAPPEQVLSVTQIKATAGNLIGGLGKDKFYIWFAGTGERLWESEFSDLPPTQSGPPTGQAGYYTNYANRRQADISFSPDGHHFATLDPQGAVQVYKVIDKVNGTDKQRIVPTFSPKSAVTKLQFSPDNHTVLLLFENNTLEVRNLNTGVSRQAFPSKLSISGVSFSPDGSRFLVSMSDGVHVSRAQIRDTASGGLVGTTVEVEVSGASFNFCVDNKTIVASYFSNQKGNGKDLTIKFLNSETGSVAGSRTITVDISESPLVNPDGKSILTYAPTGIARLWSLAPSEPATPLKVKSPPELLEEWTKKLALVFDDQTGQLKPYIQSPKQ